MDPGAAIDHDGFNDMWGQEEVLMLLGVIANPVAEGAAAGVAAPANNGHHCQWVSGGTPCSQACDNFNNLILHLGDVHDAHGPSTRVLDCHWLTENGVCGKRIRRHAFRRHISCHLGRRVACPDCSRVFSRVDSMRAHGKRAHPQQ